MKYSTTRWTAAFAAFALFGLPAAGWSQPPPPTSPTTSQQPPSAAAPEQHGAAQEHLRQAQAALNGVETASLQGKPKTQVTELKRHLNSLEKSTAKASTTASKTAAGGKDNWSTEVSAIDKILTELLGPATTSAASAPAGATGTAGKATATSPTLDETSKSKLMEVRTHVIAFAASMSGTAPAAPGTGEPASAPAAAGATTAQPTATSAAQPQATPPAAEASAQPSTPSPAAPTSATAPSPAQAQPPPAGTSAVDPEGAKRYLTAARDTLGQLTKIPAAAQMHGDARTQLTQLIANFNELITTNENWRSSYDKVTANVVALLGPDTPEPSQAPAQPAPRLRSAPRARRPRLSIRRFARSSLSSGINWRSSRRRQEQTSRPHPPLPRQPPLPQPPSPQRLRHPVAPRLSRARRRRKPRKSWAKAVRSCTSTPSKRS